MRRSGLSPIALSLTLLLAGDHRAGPAQAGHALALPPGLEGALTAREYHATPSRDGLQAPNRAHGLRTYFEPSGIRVVERTDAKAPELARIRVVGVGHGATLSGVAPGEVSSAGARVEIRRPGLTEWYENKPEGLEQGFDLATRPGGTGPLAIELEIAGAELALDDDTLLLRTGSGTRLRYDHLYAEDALGRALPARLELAARERVRLVVDDATARYPITIDPLLTRVADSYVSADQALFGTSVAGAGDVNGDGYGDLIVGAPSYDAGPGNTGAAFVFEGGPAGIATGDSASAATELNSLQDGSVFGPWFGGSVASAGDVNGDGYGDVIVGAQLYDTPLVDGGAAFVFHGGPLGVPDGDPTTAATVLLGDQAHNAGTGVGGKFGFVVASAGDVNGDGYSDVVVGAPFYSGASVGQTFVYLGGAAGIGSGGPGSAATVLSSSPADGTDIGFGIAAASAGDVNSDGYDDVIVGADKSFTAIVAYGGAFVFLGNASGIASTTTAGAATRLLSQNSVGAFGASVAPAGDVNGDGYADVIIGARAYNGGGAAFIYHGSASGIPSGTNLTAATTRVCSVLFSGYGSGYQPPAFLGPVGGVAGAGDVNGDGYSDVIVGASNYTPLGAAFFYLGSATGVPNGSEGPSSARLDGSPGSFGRSVAGAGDLNGDGYGDVVVGSPGSSTEDVGVAYMYLGGGSGISGFSVLSNNTFSSTQGQAGVGASVASAGDVNSDGYSDVIIGAPLYDSGSADEGAAFIVHGSASGIATATPATAATTLQSDQAGARFGASVAGVDDINYDGYADVVVGAPFFDDPNTDEGAAFVFLGGPVGVVSASANEAHARITSDQDSAQLGASVSSAGDVNGDGRPDLIVGAPRYEVTLVPADEGAAFVFLAGDTGLVTGTPLTAASTIRGASFEALLGSSVASAGDVNGDGYGDVLIGVPRDEDTPGESHVLIFRGSASGIASGDTNAASTRISSDFGFDRFGASVAGAGDVNGDGFDDVIAGAPGLIFGAAFLYFGSASQAPVLPMGAAATLFEGDAIGAFGATVAGAGDVNGDGLADLLVGEPSEIAQGAAWLHYGRPSFPGTTPALSAAAKLTSVSQFDAFATSVAGSGDVNGDGFADLVVGAPDAVFQAYFYAGGSTIGRPVRPRQRRGDGSFLPVQPLGDARDGDGFLVSITGTHPAGRGRVKAQVEACPAGAAFSAPMCITTTSPGWISVTAGAPTINLNPVISGLPANELIHWRARVLRADDTGQPSPNPAHGPWRRLFAQSGNGDIRISSDVDSDGVADAADNCRYRSNPLQEDGAGFGSGTPTDGIGDECQCGNVAGGGGVDQSDVDAYRAALALPAAALPGPALTRCVVLGPSTSCDVVQVAAIKRGIAVPALPPITTGSIAQVCAAALP